MEYELKHFRVKSRYIGYINLAARIFITCFFQCVAICMGEIIALLVLSVLTDTSVGSPRNLVFKCIKNDLQDIWFDLENDVTQHDGSHNTDSRTSIALCNSHHVTTVTCDQSINSHKWKQHVLVTFIPKVFFKCGKNMAFLSRCSWYIR